MYKYTKNGLKELGKPIDLSQEDLEFIRDLFDDFSNFEKSLDDRRNRADDELYGE